MMILTNYERRVLKAFAEVLIPLESSSSEAEPLCDLIEDHLRYLTKDTRLAWRACLVFFELVAFFYYAKFKTMSRMDIALRERYMNAWHHTWWSVKRTMKRFLESVIFINYYSLPEVKERIGYRPEFAVEKKLRSENSLSPCGRGLGRGGAASSVTLPLPPKADPPLAETPSHQGREDLDFPSSDLEVSVDVCVIGSGAGGAFAAMNLAMNGKKVAIIEEGSYFDANDFGGDPVEMTKKLYRAGGLVNTFGWPFILVPLGRCVGGTTVINSGTCFRTPDKVFEHWADRFGLSNWAAEKMEPYYKKVEEILEVCPSSIEKQGASNAIFERGAEQFGAALKPLSRNAPNCDGSGVCCFGCPTNAKRSVQLNAIPIAMQNGAKLFTRCRAEKIVFHSKRATRVLARFIDPVSRKKGPLLTVNAKVFIVACGTMHTPVLLDWSKVPDPSRARGKNLTMHPATKLFALFDEEIKGWKGIPQGYYSDVLESEGIKLESIFLPPAYTASTLMLSGREHKEVMDNYNRLASFGMMVSDTTHGRVIRGINGHSISIYNINKRDLPKYKRGITFLAEAFFAAGAKKVFPGIHTLPVVTREEGADKIHKLKLRNKDLDLQAFHPLGTCRMGADPREAVVDPNGRVYGMENLFVADGSLFPTSLGVNPQETIMAAALKISDFIDEST